MKKVETNKTKEAKSFRDDMLKLMQTLNGVDDENLSQEGAETLQQGIEEFASQFIYFRESYTQKSSHIRRISALMEDIREVVGDCKEKYEVTENVEEANSILYEAVNGVVGKLSDVEGNLEEAEQEELEFKRIESIERIFMEANISVQATEIVVKKVGEQIKEHMENFREVMENMDLQLAVFEKNAVEIKEQCDKILGTGEMWAGAFKEWKQVSHKQVEDAFKELAELVKEAKKEMIVDRDKELKAITDKYEEAITQITAKTDSLLGNMNALVEKTHSLLSAEGFKQVMLYMGCGFSVINFVLLIVFIFTK
ncbi:hypothetical protein [Acetobacterium bakii]|nr:hypothetical protein [Acetobacterium bakii]